MEIKETIYQHESIESSKIILSTDTARFATLNIEDILGNAVELYFTTTQLKEIAEKITKHVENVIKEKGLIF